MMDFKNLRIGQGYDIHKLKRGRKLLLGGIEIPFDKGLDGHSDADVLIHALCDALFGATNLGDLGKYFPENDKNRNISSSEILKEVIKMINSKKLEIINIDMTVIAEAPKLSPYIDKIKENIALVINLEIDRISIKAKTKEGLGAVGMGNAIEVIVVALLYKSE